MGAAACQRAASRLLTDPTSRTGLTTCSPVVPPQGLGGWFQHRSLCRMNDYLFPIWILLFFSLFWSKSTR